jgi:CRISP-associated protein Cas1
MLSKPDFQYKNVVLVMASNKEMLSFKNDNLLVKNSNGEIILQKTCYRIYSIWIIGPCSISSGLIERSKKFGFSIVLFSYSFRYVNSWNVSTEGNVLLRKKQYRYEELVLGKHLIWNKINNQIRLLKSIRRKDGGCIENIENLFRIMNEKIPQAKNIHEIMGVEGVASRIFFSEWFRPMNWQGRKPRCKTDPINVLMDIGYTLLFNYMEGMLNLYGFDVYCGVYHRFFYQRKSLVCDMIEPFRCIIDRQIRKSYNLSQINPCDFVAVKGKYYLSFKNSKPYLKFLTESILVEKEQIFDYTQRYYRAFMRDKSVEEYPIYQIV